MEELEIKKEQSVNVSTKENVSKPQPTKEKQASDGQITLFQEVTK